MALAAAAIDDGKESTERAKECSGMESPPSKRRRGERGAVAVQVPDSQESEETLKQDSMEDSTDREGEEESEECFDDWCRWCDDEVCWDSMPEGGEGESERERH